jgi:archaellum biogenesis ATPase FlaH
MARLDESQVYMWWDVMRGDNELVEVRLIGSNKTASGYFTNPKTLIEAVRPYTDNFNIYFTLNKIDPACYGREQRDRILQRVKNTTADHEIIARDWVLVDLDAKRLSGVCSTKEEAMKAYEKGQEVYQFLIDNGFYEPIVVFSSSGIHLYLRCALLNNEENTKLIKRFLNALSMLFSDEHVDCDCAVFNAARISRLPGSYSCKGANNDPTRPQRRCRFLKVPDEINVNAREYFEKIANMYPEEDTKPSRENNYSIERFDLDAFIAKHNIQIRKVETVADGKKYILDHCLFNEQHKGKDAVIFQRTSGAIAYHCFHQSCSQYTWRDVRTMFEPDAYARTPYNTYTPRRGYGAPQKEPFVPIAESVDKGKKWLQMSDIKRVDIADLMSIPTGFYELDKKIVGLFAGDLTVLSGLSASGKTSWLDCLALNVVNQGYKVAIWSGEMQDWRFQGWINQIAAGKNYTRKKQGYENLYYVPNNIADKINVWLDDKLFLYNNDYGNRFQQLFNDVKELVEEKGVQLVVLDNLAALNIEDYDSDKYSNQTKFILDIKDYAKKKNIHIVLVAHPRKQNYFLRREGISGSADLTNIADNVILVHRVGKDFETRATEFFGENQAKEYMQYSTVIEVSKNRQLGVTDFLTGLYYEHESKRLKNSVAENVLYGWYETAEQGTMIEPNGDFAISGVSPWGDSSVYEDEEAPF